MERAAGPTAGGADDLGTALYARVPTPSERCAMMQVLQTDRALIQQGSRAAGAQPTPAEVEAELSKISGEQARDGKGVPNCAATDAGVNRRASPASRS